MLLRADALCALMRFADALPLYDAAVESDAADETAALRRADCLFTLGAENAAYFTKSAEAYSDIMRTATSPEIVAECAYKIGRGIEKSGAADAALKHYYGTIVAPYDALETAPSDDAATWYSRAFFAASEILSAKGEREAAAKILRRVSDDKLPGAAEAARRIERLEHK